MKPEHTAFSPDLARVFRAESGRILAALIARCGDIQLAEDALQEACLQASAKWRYTPPNKPGAWLHTVAQRRLIDKLRRAQRQSSDAALTQALDNLQGSTLSDEESQEIPDERLKLIFTCCHPALAEQARLALTLKTLCGLNSREIARAFLVSETTMNQRLLRAKKKIRAAGIAYKVPSSTELDERLDSVLAVIYLIFNESYSAYEGQSLTRDELAQEAIRLARVLHKLLPKPEVAGLLALMLLHQSRNSARSKDASNYVPLERQDRSLWDQTKISEGRTLLLTTMAMGQIGKYQLQAAISAVHAEAAHWADTDWAQILLLYITLFKLEPTPVVELNLLVALAMSGEHARALQRLKQLETQLKDYQPYHAGSANICEQLGLVEQARDHYQRAIVMSKNSAEREFLTNCLERISQ